jgi:hypothetical protein
VANDLNSSSVISSLHAAGIRRCASGGVFKKPVAHGNADDSNQFGLVLPGLPASPKPGLNRACLVDGVFFGERHFGQVWFS